MMILFLRIVREILGDNRMILSVLSFNNDCLSLVLVSCSAKSDVEAELNLKNDKIFCFGIIIFIIKE